MNKQDQQIMKTQLSKRTFVSELSKDYSLPDYQPEIKRLLKISANILPPKTDFGMNDAVFSGNIDYYVLYLGVDNQMYCAPISDEYSINMPLEGNRWGDYLDGFVDVLPENISGRVTAPRKISIRSRIKTVADVFSNIYASQSFADSIGDESIKKLQGKVLSASMDRVLSDTVNIGDEIILDSRDGDVRVICADGKVMLSEVKGNNNEAILRGDAYVKILACREEAGEPYVIYRKLPIFASVPLKGADISSSVSGRGYINELSVVVDEGRITLDVGVIFDCTAIKNVPVEYTKDMYSTACATRCEYKGYDVVSDRGAMNCNFTSSETRTLDELGLDASSKLLDVTGCAFVDSVTLDENKMKVAGKIKYNCLMENADEYSLREIEMPFSYLTDSKRGAKNNFVTAEVVSTRGKVDGERMSLDSEISLTCKAYDSCGISTLEAMHFGEGVDTAQNQFVVIFPSREDSVWSVAKKNYVSPERILEANDGIASRLEGAELDDPKTLSSVHHIII